MSYVSKRGLLNGRSVLLPSFRFSFTHFIRKGAINSIFFFLIHIPKNKQKCDQVYLESFFIRQDENRINENTTVVHTIFCFSVLVVDINKSKKGNFPYSFSI